MSNALKEAKQRTCKACGEKFAQMFNTLQVACSPKCALAHAPANSEKARKAIGKYERREIKVRNEKLKSRADRPSALERSDGEVQHAPWSQDRFDRSLVAGLHLRL